LFFEREINTIESGSLADRSGRAADFSHADHGERNSR
jgi:hypothetical protein